MFFIIKDNKVINQSDKYISLKWLKTIEANLDRNINYIWYEYNSNEFIKTPEILQKEKEELIHEINLKYSDLAKKYDIKYPDFEILTFNQQEIEADYISWKSRLTNKNIDFLKNLAKLRQEDIKILAKKVKDKSEKRNLFLSELLAKKYKEINLLNNK